MDADDTDETGLAAEAADVSPADRIAFHMAEFEALKAEIAELVKQTTAHMSFAVAACGAILAWLLTHPMPGEVIAWARWLPLVVSGLLGLFALAAYLRVGEKGSYLRTLETRLAFPGLGWESKFRRRAPLIGLFQFVGWGVLNGLGLAAALALPFPQSQPCSAAGAGADRLPTTCAPPPNAAS